MLAAPDDYGPERQLIITPFVEEAVQAASYDIHLADRFVRFDWQTDKSVPISNHIIDPKFGFQHFSERMIKPVFDADTIVLQPGECVWAMTLERFKLPYDVCAKVYQKSTLGRLFQHNSADAGFIDPGFDGQIVLELRNNLPCCMRYYANMPCGQIVFEQVERAEPKDQYDGHYQNQDRFDLRAMRDATAKLFLESQRITNEKSEEGPFFVI